MDIAMLKECFYNLSIVTGYESSRKSCVKRKKEKTMDSYRDQRYELQCHVVASHEEPHLQHDGDN